MCCKFKGRGDVGRTRRAVTDQLDELQSEEGEVELRISIENLKVDELV